MKSIIISSLVGLLWLGTATVDAQQWRHLGLSGIEVLSLETDPVEPRNIMAGTHYQGLFVTFDWGQDWEYRIATNVPVPFISYDPIEDDSLYALVGDSYSAGLHKSDDGGNIWYVVNYLPFPRRMAFDAVNPGYRYVCFPDGIRVSQDFGRNFVEANNGLPGLEVLDVTADGVTGLQAYAAGEAFVAKTTDFGSNWNDLGGLFGLEDYNPARIEFEPNGPDTLYVSCWSYFARSFDRGQNWDYTATPTNYNVPILCDPDVPGHLYMGSKGGGVLESTDAGASFTAINDGLGNLDVNCLAFDPLGRLLAGTADGVYIYGVEDIPMLSEWGLILLGLLLIASGTAAVVKKRILATRQG